MPLRIPPDSQDGPQTETPHGLNRQGSTTSEFSGSLRVVGEWATCRRRSEGAPEKSQGKVTSARILSRMMPTGRDSVTKVEAVIVATIEAQVLMLDAARSLLSRFKP